MKLSIIIPVNKYTTKEKPLLKKAVSSIYAKDFEYEIVIVGPSSVIKKVDTEYGKTEHVRLIVNEGKTDDTFRRQVVRT